MYLPSFESNLTHINAAFRIALGDIAGNIRPYQGPMSSEAKPCILAGLDYDKPWTRDAAFNTWYALAALDPETARNTLESVLMRDEHGLRVGGQYWDAIIWAVGAWQLYLETGDRPFLQQARETVSNSLTFFEQTEQDPEDHLFRGAACFQDGIAGYPDRFADAATSNIHDWVLNHPQEKHRIGVGLPIKALSTNCLYAQAYSILAEMNRELHVTESGEHPGQKAEKLRQAINQAFWNAETGTYRYLTNPEEDPGRQEGFGHAFALLFGIANAAQRTSILKQQTITPNGIPCVWPVYERYAACGDDAFGRHSGTVWPQVNAAWASACRYAKRPDLAWREVSQLAEKACRDSHFAEIYHPLTGAIYGGMQEMPPEHVEPVEWESCRRQSWCATGFLFMVTQVLAGFQSTPQGLRIEPWLPPEMDSFSLGDWPYRDTRISLYVSRGEKGEVRHTIPCDEKGAQVLNLIAG